MARPDAMRKHLRLEQVSHRYANSAGAFAALRDINLDIAKGEVVSLVGHSGCGKSTLLHLIAGLIRPTKGVLLCAEKEITSPGPERAVVFQNNSLLPWLNCFQNVHLAVERVFASGTASCKLRDKAMSALEQVGLGAAMHKYPKELSSGMKQRVSLARALAIEPEVLLLDEPFNSLDPLTRVQLQDVLLQTIALHDTTVVIVTHDIDEAVLLSDRIVLLEAAPQSAISRIVNVDIPRPRDRLAMLENTTYAQCRNTVYSFLNKHDNDEGRYAAI